jgi:hypothetical protein
MKWGYLLSSEAAIASAAGSLAAPKAASQAHGG